MAMWRDPLDELISDLERTLPPAPAFQDIPPQEDFCFWATRFFVARDRPEKLRLSHDPRVRRVQAYLDRLPAIRERSAAVEARAHTAPAVAGEGASELLRRKPTVRRTSD